VFVPLVIQHAKRMRRTAICSVSGSTTFSHIISKAARFSRKKNVGHEICVLISLQILCETFLIVTIIERDISSPVPCKSAAPASPLEGGIRSYQTYRTISSFTLLQYVAYLSCHPNFTYKRMDCMLRRFFAFRDDLVLYFCLST
jgi:hypothetical protein